MSLSSDNRATGTLILFHTSVCGPIEVTLNEIACYFVVFIDHSSGWSTVYPTENKSGGF